MAMRRQICACVASQSSFYTQASEPKSYKYLDYIDRSSTSVLKHLDYLSKGTDSPHESNRPVEPKSTHVLFKCCSQHDETHCAYRRDTIEDDSFTDTLMDTGFTEETNNDFDSSDTICILQDTTLDTAFSEHCDSWNHTTSDNASTNTHSTCSSNEYLVSQKHPNLSHKNPIAKTFKKLAKCFH